MGWSAVTQQVFHNSNALRLRAHTAVPGGAHTYAKGDDQFPVESPGFIARGQGCRVWDVDGNQFIEYGSGLRSVTLGHAFAPVVEAVRGQLEYGTNFARPAPIEVEAAEQFLSLIGGAQMVKFAKNGSDATTAAVRLARAYTGRELVAICQDHPFFSVDDWFIGSTDMHAGIPEPHRRLTLKFKYNDLEDLRRLLEENPKRVACVVMEAENAQPPAPEYLRGVRALCDAHGALMVLDEVVTGFRWHLNGAQAYYGIRPDLSTFGKGMANGFAVSALAGSREIMQLGGFDHGRERVFLLSYTHGGETHSLAAALATMKAYRELNVVDRLWRQGERLTQGIQQITDDLGIGDYFHVSGKPCCLIFVTKDPARERSQIFRTLFLQEMIRRGVLCPNFVVNYAHDDAAIDQTLEAAAGALKIYSKALEDGPEQFLTGRPVRPVMRHS
jgi:glutamate-1-semialdehyde 2,1-aminomutase